MNDKTETLNFDQTAKSLATRCAIQERLVQANGKKKQVWQKNADYVAFPLSAFLPGFDTPYALEVVELGDEKEKVQRIRYADERVQYVYDAVAAKIEAAAKAKISTGNAPAESIEELLTASRGGQYMADVAAVRNAIKEYLLGKGNPEAKVAGVVALLNPQVLVRAEKGKRDIVKAVIATVSEAVDLSGYQTVIDNILKAAEGEDTDLSDVQL